MSEFPLDPTADLPFAYGGPPLQGVLRAQPEDFQVDEQLGYTACGEGEHAFLQVRKRGHNTTDVARALARFAGVRQVDVGFAGLKDRQAVTTQTFSVHLPGKPDPDWSALDLEGVKVLNAKRHNRKVRRGSLRGNTFVLRLRQTAGDHTAAEQVLEQVRAAGVPNYFGAQRFGREASNLQRADSVLSGQGRRPKPEQRRMVVSAVRSYLFNQVLAERVRDGSWQQLLPGEVVLLNKGGQFAWDAADSSLAERLAAGDIHPSGPLPGQPSRALAPNDQALAIEQGALQDERAVQWQSQLERNRVDADRRALRMALPDLVWSWVDQETLELRFSLGSGSYATALVRELMRD